MTETGSLLRGAAAPLLALLAWLRGSRQREAAAEAEAAAEVEAAALFAAHVRRECASSTSPCVLDVCAKDILNYPQGAFALIEDDLARAPPDIDSAASIRVLRQACQLPQVFAHRKELLHGQSVPPLECPGSASAPHSALDGSGRCWRFRERQPTERPATASGGRDGHWPPP